MFIPLYDHNPWRSIGYPWVTRMLIVVTILIYVVFQSGLVLDTEIASLGGYAVIPAEFNMGGGLRSTYAVVPEPVMASAPWSGVVTAVIVSVSCASGDALSLASTSIG